VQHKAVVFKAALLQVLDPLFRTENLATETHGRKTSHCMFRKLQLPNLEDRVMAV
jgi:hypothetical protein